MKPRSYIHVFLQFATLFGLVFFFNKRGALPWYFVFTYLSVFLALWATWVMRKSTLTVMPDPGNKFIIISKGPYRVIRHPMYASLFLFIIPLVIYDLNFINVSLFLLFAVNQIMKLIYEENIIVAKYPEYLNYKQKTWRLLPYIF